jgi:peptidoglycan/LPS O-acetylase OafA/YrhL
MMTNTVSNIQVLRAAAALLVVLSHLLVMTNANYETAWDVRFGFFGVDIFFVISGFIMFYTNRSMERDAANFFAGRLLRIVPLYWLATIILVLIFLIGFHPNGLHYLDLPIFVRSMFFVPSEFPDGRRDLVLSLGWTLMYELYFYIIFASTLLMRSLEKSLIAITVVFVAGIFIKAAFGPFPYLIEYYLSTILLEFVFGALIAIAYIRWSPGYFNWLMPLAVGLVLAGLGLALLASKVTDAAAGRGGLRFLFFGVPASLIVAGSLIFEKSGWILKNRFALLLGAASYSLYLFHPILLQPTVKSVRLLLPVPLSISLYCAIIMAVIIALAGAVVIHLAIEKKIMDFGAKHILNHIHDWRHQSGLRIEQPESARQSRSSHS